MPLSNLKGINDEYNYSGTGQYARAYLDKNTPSEGGTNTMGVYNTTDSSDNPQAVTGPLNNARVQPKHDVYILLHIFGTQPRVFGFELKYRPL